MFTLQAASIEAMLSQAGMPIEQANAISNGFGNCMQRLNHRGTVEFDGPFITRGDVNHYGDVNFNPRGTARFKSNVDFSKATFVAPIPYQATPPLQVKLTSGVARATEGGIYVWKATAKLLRWSPDDLDYLVLGDEFDVYEINRRFRHAMEDDTGAIAWDFYRKVPYLYEMNTPSVRHVTLDADLARDANVSGVDIDTGQAIARINGRTVPTGEKIEMDTPRVVIQWFPFADSSTGAAHDGDGVWRPIGSDTCTVTA